MIGPQIEEPTEANEFDQKFIVNVLDSYHRVTGLSLIEQESLEVGKIGRSVYFGNFALLTHRGGDEAILNYGNQFALRLWEHDWRSFTSTPSTMTAPPNDRESREKLMNEVGRKNFATGYDGRRVSRSGKLFVIKNATIWRLLDDKGEPFGVGAYFREIERLTEMASPNS